MPVVAVGQIAPSFELKGVDGESKSLAEALGRGPVLAAIFKVSCPTCQFTLPFVERIYRQFVAAGAKQVQFWGISQDNAKESRQFAKEFNLTFPILLDEDHYRVSREYGVEYVPTLFLIAPDGRVEIARDGFSKRDLLDIQRALAQRLAVKPPELFQPSEKIPEYKPG